MICAECLQVECECTAYTLRAAFVLACALLALVLGCAPCPCDRSQGTDASAPPKSAPKPPMVPDPEVEPKEYGEPCDRTERVTVQIPDAGAWTVSYGVPCRRYDVKRDLPYPPEF